MGGEANHFPPRPGVMVESWFSWAIAIDPLEPHGTRVRLTWER